jgi:hypothetical protein
MGTQITLTAFQAEEVEGLLNIIDDQNSIAEADEDFMPVWGVVNGPRSKRVLTVLDGQAHHAIIDLEYRAEWSMDEGGLNGCAVAGYGCARSLLALADKIRKATA